MQFLIDRHNSSLPKPIPGPRSIVKCPSDQSNLQYAVPFQLFWLVSFQSRLPTGMQLGCAQTACSPVVYSCVRLRTATIFLLLRTGVTHQKKLLLPQWQGRFSSNRGWDSRLEFGIMIRSFPVRNYAPSPTWRKGTWN